MTAAPTNPPQPPPLLTEEEARFRQEIVQELTARYGQLIPVRQLNTILGFPSYDALRRAAIRGTLGIPLISIPGRKVRCAMPGDVADWLLERWRDARRISRASQKEDL